MLIKVVFLVGYVALPSVVYCHININLKLILIDKLCEFVGVHIMQYVCYNSNNAFDRWACNNIWY